jgi:CRISPR-associated RAMP protein (TIGR02581 family)
MTQDALATRYELRNRYVFEGKLEMRTALHIGGGKATLSHTDNPIVLTPEGMPFIPGSSFKGTLRSTVEKLVSSLPRNLGLHSCGLLPEKDARNESCSTAHRQKIALMRREDPTKSEEILEEAHKQLCHTCQLFGSPFAAARIIIDDLYLINDEWCGTTQIRDGVAIHRDTETAIKGHKYDFEVVPVTTVFAMRVVIENATEQDLQLISIGLSEFVNGFGGVGGLRSRGLGACILNDNDLKISNLELTKGSDPERMQRLQRYLLYKELTPVDTQEFFNQHINTLFEGLASDR